MNETHSDRVDRIWKDSVVGNLNPGEDLAWLVEQVRWIPIEEGPPDRDHRCELITDDAVCAHTYGRWDKQKKVWTDEIGNRRITAVNHWRYTTHPSHG